MTKLFCIIAALLVAVGVAGAAGGLYGPLEINNVSTNAAVLNAVTGNLVYASIDAVTIELTFNDTVLKGTNNVATAPDFDGSYWHLIGAYATSNLYMLDTEDYYIFYTGGVWHIAATADSVGITNVIHFTNPIELGSYTSVVESATSSGTVSIASYSTADVDMDIVTQSGLVGALERTILSADDLVASKTYYPREIAETTAGVDISNEPTCVPMQGDRPVVRLYDAITTNIDARVWFYLK